MYSIGVDLGGTKLFVAVVDTQGQIKEKRLLPTNIQGGVEAVRQQIVQAIKELIEERGKMPQAVGLGLAGQIDAKSGQVLLAPNLKWQNVPIKEMLEQDLGIAINVTNDVRAATWAEWHYGMAKDCSDFVTIFVGTGLGGGIVCNNQMLLGATNSAGELGHMIIQMDGRACRCGQKGCLEAYASGWAIAEEAARVMNRDQITTKEVAAKFREGDPLAKQIIDKVILALIAGSVNVVNSLNPKRLIFGGGVINGIPELLLPVQVGIKQHALQAATRELEITLSVLGPDAGVIGASVFALEAANGH